MKAERESLQSFGCAKGEALELLSKEVFVCSVVTLWYCDNPFMSVFLCPVLLI